jgi:hypothetical protein
MLLERAYRALRLWDPSLFHYLSVFEESEAPPVPAHHFEKLPKVTVQLADFQ